MFEHNFVNLPQLKTTDINGRRHYITPEGAVYPSITTVLSAKEPQELKEWKRIIGEDEAERIALTSAGSGQAFHDLCEKYLRNTPNYDFGYFPDVMLMFRQALKSINRISNIMAIESPLYSNRLQIAGRCDVIAKYKNLPAIIDFKSNRTEPMFIENKIEKYFVQCKGYAEMFEERTGVKINIGVLIVSSVDYGLTTYVDDLHKYNMSLNQAIDYYKEIIQLEN
jgi:hypothetical protein